MVPYLNMTPVAGNADKAFAIVSAEFQITWVLILYILGVIATAWHLAYGLFLFAVDWGLVIGEKAQKMTLTACMGVALMLSFVGINAAFSFVRPCGLMPQAMCEAPKKTASTGAAKF
jgi:succinate dehydrogenase / fumarate reductase cytochrome b subunit